MEEIGIRDLKARACEILRRVREERASYSITYRGKVIARLEAIPEEDELIERSLAVLADMERLAQEMAADGPQEALAVDVIREQRREL